MCVFILIWKKIGLYRLTFNDLELESNFIEMFEIFIKFHLIFSVTFPPDLTDFYNFIMCTVDYDTPRFQSADLLKKLKHF